MKTLTKILGLSALAMMLVGCKFNPNQIVLLTGTMLGFDVSQSPAGSSPQATLAYKRTEFAMVPCTTNGIAPDVLMDFDFKTSIFTSGGGIHSRIATGEHATTQSPAALMMSRDRNGLYPANLPMFIRPPTLNTNK